MKLRNQLLALFCLLLFFGFGVLYIRVWVVSKPFAIILFITDGMVPRHITAARLYAGGAGHRLTIDSFPHLALMRNPGRDFAVPDTAAATTALATGTATLHRHLAMDPDGNSLVTILELAGRKGRATGIVTNGKLTDPGVAAFYAHAADMSDAHAVAAQFSNASLRVALGGGSADGLAVNERIVVRNKAQLENIGSYQANGVLGLFSKGEMAHADQIESGSRQPSLADMTRRAIEFLQYDRRGYVLVVDASLFTAAAKRNEGERTITEMLALDRAVQAAQEYAGDNSLILVTGRHAIGGMTLNGFPLRQDSGIPLLGVAPAGYPSITWATGPNGPGAEQPTRAKLEPAAWLTPAAVPTVEDMIAIGRGDGAEKLEGFMENTDVFAIMRDAL